MMSNEASGDVNNFMRFQIWLCASAALVTFFSAVNGEETKASPQNQLRLLITPSDTTQTITRAADDQTAQRGEFIVTCDSMTFDQGGYVIKNGTLEMEAGYYSFSECLVTFSEKSITISPVPPNKSLKDIKFQLKEGKQLPPIRAAAPPPSKHFEH
jgi:hypothetical protein